MPRNLKRSKQKAGFVEEVDEETKKKAFSELGRHLDHIFQHLSHKTGALKFTCIAGRQNPITGEVVVLDFHLGDTEEGADFSAHYPRFSEVQAAYATFLQEALSHDDNVQALERDNEHDHCSGVDNAKGRNVESSEDESENVESGEDELENDTYNVPEEHNLSGEEWHSGNNTYNVLNEHDLSGEDWHSENDTYNVSSEHNLSSEEWHSGNNTYNVLNEHDLSGEDWHSENDTYNVSSEHNLSSEDWHSENDTYNVSNECNPGPIPSLTTPSELALQDFDSFWTTAPTLVPDILGNTDHNIML
ncbi:hypothetical protein BD769DRAFT_1662660 [Suillus cothurnatus]|nr:hypothetical protein BD769DRAFT_1662660 [Suillus cothurnatus]